VKKGVILEINERVLTLLTPEGEFLQAKKAEIPYEIGQEIYFTPLENEHKFKALSLAFLKKRSIALATLALLVFVATMVPFAKSNEVYAYMSIDVNPSIELGVNKNLQVVELKSFNESGKGIIEQLDHWKKEDIQTVTDRILFLLQEEYLDEQGEVIVGTIHTGEVTEGADKRLAKVISNIKTKVEKEKADFISIEATPKERKQAEQKGITAGKYVEEKEQLKVENDDNASKSPEKTPKASMNKSRPSQQKQNIDKIPANNQNNEKASSSAGPKKKEQVQNPQSENKGEKSNNKEQSAKDSLNDQNNSNLKEKPSQEKQQKNHSKSDNNEKAKKSEEDHNGKS
jgi:hypothetical protein